MSTDRPTALLSTERAGPTPGGADTPASSLSPGEVVNDRYELTKLLGAGGQGEVWRAEDRAITGHVVALKLLRDRPRSEREREESLRELRMLAAVSHPSVVQFKDHGWFAGRLWFVMPWYEGKDLEASMPLSRADARRIFETLAGGLSAVHAKGLRHQDIKPSNILLAQIDGLDQSLPVLLDFGVAAKTGEQLVAGSPDYFAPELASGWPTPANVGPAADVFSLALTLRNALDPTTATGLDPFDPESLARRGSVPITPPSGSDLAFLAPHFARWLAIDPAVRPSASELIGELEVLTMPEDRGRERRLVLRRALPWVALLLAVVSALGWVGWGALVDARKAAAAEAVESEAARLQADEASHRAEDLGVQLDDAMERASSSSARSEEALARLTEAEASIDRAEGSAEQMLAARNRLRAALADARAEIAHEQQALADTQASVARLTSDLAAARQSLGEATAAGNVLRDERDGFRTERDGLRTERDGLRTERDGLRTERDGLRTERDTARAELEAARAHQSAAEASLAAARAEVETERSGRATDRASAQAASQEAAASLGRLEARVATLERQLADARTPPREPAPSAPVAPTPIAPSVSVPPISPVTLPPPE